MIMNINDLFSRIPFFRNLVSEGDIVGGSFGSLGRAVSEERELGFFEHVDTTGAVDVEIVFGDAQKVTVEGSRLSVDAVRTVVVDHELHITRELIRQSDGGRAGVRITMPAPLKTVSLHGSGDVSAEGLDQDDFHAVNTGSGDLSVTGRVVRAYYRTTGSGRVDAEALTAAEIEVKSTGSGNVKAHASEKATIVSKGSGNVNVKGWPGILHSSKTGSGNVKVR